MLDLQNTHLAYSSFYLDRVALQFSSELANNDLDPANWKVEINGQIYDVTSVFKDPGPALQNSEGVRVAWDNTLKIYIEGVSFETSDNVKVIYTPTDEPTDLAFVAGDLSNGAPLYVNDVWEAEIASNPFLCDDEGAWIHDTGAMIDLSTGQIVNVIVYDGYFESEPYTITNENGDNVGYFGGYYAPNSFDNGATVVIIALLIPAKYWNTEAASLVAQKYWMGGTVDLGFFQLVQNFYENYSELSLFMTTAASELNGGRGSDLIYSESESRNNTINAGSGSDTIMADLFFTKDSGGKDTINAGDGADVVYSGGGNDVITSGNGNDKVVAGAGNDLIVGGNGAGNDKYFGGTGTDTLKYTSATAAISVDLATGIATSIRGGDAAGIGTDTLSDIENIIAGNFNDRLTGNDAANRIEGLGGHDRLNGGAGADRLNGGSGKDVLTGAAGNDTFIFNNVVESAITATTTDVITDFVIGQDKIDLSAIDAFNPSSANDTFVWKGTAAFNSTTQGEIRYQNFDNDGTDNDYTMVWIDNDRDKDVEMAIRLTGLYTLSASDFIL